MCFSGVGELHESHEDIAGATGASALDGIGSSCVDGTVSIVYGNLDQCTSVRVNQCAQLNADLGALVVDKVLAFNTDLLHLTLVVGVGVDCIHIFGQTLEANLNLDAGLQDEAATGVVGALNNIVAHLGSYSCANSLLLLGQLVVSQIIGTVVEVNLCAP